MRLSRWARLPQGTARQRRWPSSLTYGAAPGPIAQSWSRSSPLLSFGVDSRGDGVLLLERSYAGDAEEGGYNEALVSIAQVAKRGVNASQLTALLRKVLRHDQKLGRMDEKRALHERLVGVVGSAKKTTAHLEHVLKIANEEGIAASQELYTELLQLYSRSRGEKETEEVWKNMQSLNLEKRVAVFEALMRSHARAGSLKKIESLLREMEQKGIERTPAIDLAVTKAELLGRGIEAALAVNAAKESESAVAFGASVIMQECCRVRDLEHGLKAYDQIIASGSEPDAVALSHLMELHSKCGDAAIAKKIYARIIDAGWKPHVAGARAFVARMSENGQAQIVKRVLEQMTQQGFPVGPELWQHLILAHVKSDNLRGAYQVLDDMRTGEISERPNRHTYLPLLGHYAEKSMYKEAKQLMQQMTREGIEPQGEETLLLLQAMLSAGKIAEATAALTAFQEHPMLMKEPRFQISAHNQVASAIGRREGAEAHEAFIQVMKERGVTPESYTYSGLLRRYCDGMRKGAWSRGKAKSEPNVAKAIQLIEHMQSIGVKVERHYFNSILSAYGRKGDTLGAREFFQQISSKYGGTPDISAHACMIQAHAEAGDGSSAMGFLTLLADKMESRELVLKESLGKQKSDYRYVLVAVTALANHYARMRSLEDIKALETVLERLGIAHMHTTTVARVELLLDRQKHTQVKKLLEKTRRHTFGEWSLNRLKEAFHVQLRWLALRDQATDAEEVLIDMRRLGVPRTNQTYSLVLSPLARAGEVERSRILMQQMELEGIKADTISYSALVHAYCSAKDIKGAKEVFEEMREAGVEPNGITYATLVYAYALEGRMQEAIETAQDAEALGLSHTGIYNAILASQVERGDVPGMQRLMKQMHAKGVKLNSHSFSALAKGFLVKGDIDSAQRVVDMVIGMDRSPKRVSEAIKGIVLHYIESEMVEEAEEQVAKLDRLGITSKHLLYQVALAYIRQGNKERLERLIVLMRGRFCQQTSSLQEMARVCEQEGTEEVAELAVVFADMARKQTQQQSMAARQ